jgi:hypothetical protein
LFDAARYYPFAKVAEPIGMKREQQVDGIAGNNFPKLIYAIERQKYDRSCLR